MFKRAERGLLVLLVVWCFGAASSFGEVYSKTGWEAKLSTLAHNVSGTVRIVDHNTLDVENFYYDGGGPLVYFYLGKDNVYTDFFNGLGVGPLLTGTPYSNGSLTIDLPPGETLDDYNAISVWCEDFHINFGSGTFGSVVEYELTFDATWSSTTHPNVPPEPNFSGLIGGSHNQLVSFWEPGSLASDAVETLAELGDTGPLSSTVNTAILAGNAYSVISAGAIDPSPNSVSVTFKMHSGKPLVTVASRIGLSPDWFVGVSNMVLFDNGQWLGEAVVDLYAYDAGTDSGTDFNSPDLDTNPADPITQITGYPFGGEPPLGTFTFKLICNNPPAGDLNGDCRVDFFDFASMAGNWLLDCNTKPGDPACQ